jgi:hypothetical protein
MIGHADQRRNARPRLIPSWSAKAGYPRLCGLPQRKTWMAGPRPGHDSGIDEALSTSVGTRQPTGKGSIAAIRPSTHSDWRTARDTQAAAPRPVRFSAPNTGAGAAVSAHETPTGKLHRTNYIPAMPRQLPLPDAVVLPMGLRRIAASIASTYGDDGAVVITSGRDGIRIGVHNLEPSELRNILCVAIYHAVKKMRE